MRVERSGKTVRLWTRNGRNWTDRFLWMVQAALKNREQHFVLDAEAVVLGVDGVSDFNAPHSRRHDEEVQLYAFDIVALDGEDLRSVPLSMRKSNLARLLRGRPESMFVAAFEAGEIGPELFSRGCAHRRGEQNICRDVNQFTSDEAAWRQYQVGTLSEPGPGNDSGPNGDTGIGAWIDEHGLTERISPVRPLPTLLLRSAQ